MKRLLTAFCILFTVQSGAEIIYVDKDSNALFPNGTSWAQAYRSYLDIDYDNFGPGDEVWIAEGTYTSRIMLRNEIPVYGGFQGSETQRSQRDWENNVVTIVQQPPADYSLNGYAAITATYNSDWDLPSITLIDGIRLVNWGNILDSQYLISVGSAGGNADMTISNCIFTLGGTNDEMISFDLDAPETTLLMDNCVFEFLDIGKRAQNNTNVNRTIEYRDCTFESCTFAGESPDDWAFRNSSFVRTRISECGMPAMAAWGCNFNSSLIEDCFFFSENSSALHACDVINTTMVNNFCGKRLAASADFFSCIFYNNSTYTGLPLLSATQSYAINSILQETYDGPGSNNYVGDPQFTNPAQGDYTLTECSKAVDNSGLAISLLLTDLAGNQRVFNENIDAGCYEFQGVGKSIIYVDKNAVGDADGSSWEDAYTHIQDALDNQCQHSEVWVSNDIYYPNPNTGSPNRFASIYIPDGTKLYGGFEGDETSKEQRPILTDDSALRTRILGNNSTATQSDDAYRNISIASGASEVVIDGFYTSLGRADGFGSYSAGGAIYAQDVDAVIRNCRFEANSGTLAGAVLIAGDSQVEMINCFFGFNSTDGDGGAIACQNQMLEEPELQLDRCWFVGNSASNGGAVYADNSAVLITNSILNINTATDEGDAVYADEFLQMVNCTVQGHGEAVHIRSTNFVYNCIFWENDDDFTYGLSVEEGDQEVAFTNLSSMIAGPGNTSLNPLFEDADLWLFELQAGSPCVDSGETALAEGNLDQEGNARIFGSDVDRGAIEFSINCSATNDLCENAVEVDPSVESTYFVDMSCASPEVLDTDNPCGQSGARSLWYTFTMPSHAVDVFLGEDPLDMLSDRSITFYLGSCGDLTTVNCAQSLSLFGSFNPGDQVFMKLQHWSADPDPIQLNFVPRIPQILSVLPTGQGVCEPEFGTSLYDQEIKIEHENGEHYDSFLVNGESYPATASPMTVVLQNLSADGEDWDIEVIIEETNASMTISNFEQSPCCAPLNDDCSLPQPISMNNPIIGRLDCASEGAEDVLSSCTLNPGRSVWYEFIAPPTGAVDLTCAIVELNGNFNVRISVWDVSNGCSNAIEVGCINDNPDNLGENGIVSGLNPGQPYQVMISGWEIHKGTYQLTVKEAEGSVCGCVGDFDNDCVIAGSDLLVFLANFGCAGNCVADFDGDLTVNSNDLLTFLSVYNSTCN